MVCLFCSIFYNLAITVCLQVWKARRWSRSPYSYHFDFPERPCSGKRQVSLHPLSEFLYEHCCFQSANNLYVEPRTSTSRWKAPSVSRPRFSVLLPARLRVVKAPKHGIVSKCVFTSAWSTWTALVMSSRRSPAFPSSQEWTLRSLLPIRPKPPKHAGHQFQNTVHPLDFFVTAKGNTCEATWLTGTA